MQLIDGSAYLQPFQMLISFSLLEVADDNEGSPPLEVDILIGSDAYCSVGTGKSLKVARSPVAASYKTWMDTFRARREGLPQIYHSEEDF